MAFFRFLHLLLIDFLNLWEILRARAEFLLLGYALLYRLFVRVGSLLRSLSQHRLLTYVRFFLGILMIRINKTFAFFERRVFGLQGLLIAIMRSVVSARNLQIVLLRCCRLQLSLLWGRAWLWVGGWGWRFFVTCLAHSHA